MSITARLKEMLRTSIRQPESLAELTKLLAIPAASSHTIIAAGTFATVAGSANQAITVTGAKAADLTIVTLKTAGATPRTVLTATTATNAVNVVMSGDPSTDHVLSYIVLRLNT